MADQGSVNAIDSNAKDRKAAWPEKKVEKASTIIGLPAVKEPKEVKAPQADAETERICITLEVSGKMDFEPELLGVRVTESLEIVMIHDDGFIAKLILSATLTRL